MLAPAERVAKQMELLHDPSQTIYERINDQFNQILESRGPVPAYIRAWRNRVLDTIERVISIARARNIDIPSKCITLKQEQATIDCIHMFLGAVENDGNEWTFTKCITFDVDSPHRDSPESNCPIWDARWKTWIFRLTPHGVDHYWLYPSKSTRICLVETIVETWIEPLYGGPHAYTADVEWKWVTDKMCTCNK